MASWELGRGCGHWPCPDAHGSLLGRGAARAAVWGGHGSGFIRKTAQLVAYRRRGEQSWRRVHILVRHGYGPGSGTGGAPQTLWRGRPELGTSAYCVQPTRTQLPPIHHSDLPAGGLVSSPLHKCVY